MLILASTSDKLRVNCSAGTVNIHASWLDNVSGAVNPGRTNTTLTGAGTFDVVAAPAAGVFRNVKTLYVHNLDATSKDITVIHTDGTIVAELYKTTLAGHATLSYIDELGFVSDLSATQLVEGLVRRWTFTKITATNAAWPVPAGTRELKVEAWGGGSSGAGASAGWRGAGGGGGGYVCKFYSGIMDATLNITIGQGGPGAGDGSNGNPGASTTVVGANLGTLTAGGGLPAPRTGRSEGGSGGGASGGDININGGDGYANAFNFNDSPDGIYGFGGDSPRGGMGGKANVTTPGGIPGGGGAGANHPGGTSSGAGARGEVHIFSR
jgi:hypothetical protein